MYWHPRLNGIFPEINGIACACKQAPNLQASLCDILKDYPGNGHLFVLSLTFPLLLHMMTLSQKLLFIQLLANAFTLTSC